MRKEQKLNALFRREIKAYYSNKYYNIFMNRFKFPTLDYQQNNYIFKQLWTNGRISCFQLKETIGSDEYPNGVLVFTDYAPVEYNIYDFPVYVTLINKRGVKWIPSTLQEVDKDVVLCYIQRNEKGIKWFVDSIVDKIVECEMNIYQNLKAIKTPMLIPVSPEDEVTAKRIVNQMDETDPFIFIPSEYADRIKALNSQAQYYIDKLYNYRCALENELREYLGVKNLGFAEKKEHLLDSEIEQNDEITKTSGDVFYNCLLEFSERVKDVFGYDLPVEMNSQDEDLPAKENEEEEDLQDDFD